MKYVDYVLCKRDMNYHAELFVAPAFSGLQQGDLVVVEPDRKDMIAKVLGVITIEQNDIQSRDFVLMVTKTEGEPRRVLSKIRYQIFKYEEDDND